MTSTQNGRTFLSSVLLLIGVSVTAHATTMTVTTTADTTANDGQCSLREAIVAANTNAASGAAAGECPAGSSTGTDTVVLTNATYGLTSSVPDTVYGATGLPTVTSAITIRGHGATIRRASGVFRIARVDAGGTLTLDQVRIRGGRVAPGSANGYGGGLLNLDGTLILINNTVVQNNTVRVNGGGWWGGGGGIRSTGTLSVSQSTISNNVVDVTSDSCSRAVGGGLDSMGTTTITDSVITANRALAERTASCVAAAWGGGVSSALSLTLTRTAISGNEATSSSGVGLGGGLHLFDGTVTVEDSGITGNTASGPDGSRGGGIYFNIEGNNSSTISNTTISDNAVSGGGHGTGGGISLGIEMPTTSLSLTLANVTITNNRADNWGGGVYEDGLSSLTVTNSIIAGNQVGGSVTDPTADCSLLSIFAGNGHNLVGAGTGCPATQAADRSVHPSVVFTNVLDPVASSDGITQAHALRDAAGNPAVNAADPATCAAAPVDSLDQLGASRSFDGGVCDIGAVELRRSLRTLTVTSSATVAPSTVTLGGTATITASITATLTQALLVDVEIYDAANVQVYQQFFDAEPFTANLTRQFAVGWPVPTDLVPGAYTVKIGVFSPVNPGWSPLFSWNDSAASITVDDPND